MPKKTDRDMLETALDDLKVRRKAVMEKIAELRRLIAAETKATAGKASGGARRSSTGQRSTKPSSGTPAKGETVRRAPVRRKKPTPAAGPADGNIAEEHSQIAAAFDNKAGRYELIRVEDGQAHYSFTNRQGKTVDATMPLIMWRRMQAKTSPPASEE
jgi:hypothetical protein